MSLFDIDNTQQVYIRLGWTYWGIFEYIWEIERALARKNNGHDFDMHFMK